MSEGNGMGPGGPGMGSAPEAQMPQAEYEAPKGPEVAPVQPPVGLPQAQPEITAPAGTSEPDIKAAQTETVPVQPDQVNPLDGQPTTEVAGTTPAGEDLVREKPSFLKSLSNALGFGRKKEQVIPTVPPVDNTKNNDDFAKQTDPQIPSSNPNSPDQGTPGM